MNTDNLTKWQKLLINIYNDGPVCVNDFDEMESYGIAISSKQAFQSMLYSLKKKGYLYNDNGDWRITEAGVNYVEELDEKLNADYSYDDSEITKHLANAKYFADLAQKFVADPKVFEQLKKTMPNNNKMYEENNVLRKRLYASEKDRDYYRSMLNEAQAENRKLKQNIDDAENHMCHNSRQYEEIIKNLKNRISEISKQLDNKTRRCEHLENAINRIADTLGACKKWALNMVIDEKCGN